MNQVELQNNEFLRQFETPINWSLARIEYAEQNRKLFLTKLLIPEGVNEAKFEKTLIDRACELISHKNLKVVTTPPTIARIVRNKKSYE